MIAMLDSLDLYWERKHNLIRVKSWETRYFTINYIRLIRSGSESAESKVSSGTDGSDSNQDGGGGESGAISITQEDTVEFWNELEEQLSGFVSDEGRIIVNRLSGTVQISDRHPRIMEVARFIAQINQSIHRQVDIDVKIFEVSLTDDFSLGVDWSCVADGGEGTNSSISTNNGIAQPAGGFPAKLASLALSVFNIKDGARSISAVLNALQEQGNVKVVSQPKIRTLNNQAAMVKVGTDRTFFRREVSTDNTSAGSTTTIEDVPQLITEGVTLAITPQISTDGWNMMDVSPVVTRVSSVSTIVDDKELIQSCTPYLDIRQTSSFIRSRSGETVVIGGLIQGQNSTTERSVPLLGDIPFLGKLFRGTYKTKIKKGTHHVCYCPIGKSTISISGKTIGGSSMFQISLSKISWLTIAPLLFFNSTMAEMSTLDSLEQDQTIIQAFAVSATTDFLLDATTDGSSKIQKKKVLSRKSK